LAADAFIRGLAARGHLLHVAVGEYKLANPYPSNVVLHRISSPKWPIIDRLTFAYKVRSKFNELKHHIKFDVIHQLNPVVTGLSLGLGCLRCPIIMGPYVPDWPEECSERNGFSAIASHIKRWSRRSLLYCQHWIASGIIFSTPAALTKLRRKSDYPDKLYVIPYGVDSDRFSPQPFPERKSILFLAHLGRHKGIFSLLEAFPSVLDAVPDCQLLIAGTGPERSHVKKVVDSDLKVRDRVTFIGPVPREEVASRINQCSVYCLPSRGEPFGLTALEAMACGRPVVSTDSSGLAFLVPDGGGRKVPVGDSNALALALIELLKNDSLASQMGRFNRQIVEDLYAWPKIIQRLEQIYEAVSARNNMAPDSGPVDNSYRVQGACTSQR
jgi:glycosyltransferase involved in cell wall biosynthesis